ncbi:nitrilase-related carbon-nitrogen hydrolase [Agromyces bauzanensis]|uniref:Carbon-nitrogen hydrolase n=1 Tax=Agromyces bauzanensis TaxID=1308924 RepID=A0A917PL27_9MICO|nr:nitrilase-related carbon-nitrogen hydrolase [Agromyces bauzanensis]GGJ83467.1 carbon-nitrogen hydrolase [Agromyces bauzanensis]
MARIAVAQFAPLLGDVDANLERVTHIAAEARAGGAGLLVTPELALHGYDLGAISPETAIAATDQRLPELTAGGIDVLLGYHERRGMRLHNSASYLSAGGTVHTQRKLYLPNYLAWEEKKHSSAGQALRAFDTGIGRVGVVICNDAWQPMLPWLLAQDGAEVLFMIADSSADVDADQVDNVRYWGDLLEFHARMCQSWVVFCNRVGVESGATFWGGSRVIDPRGETVAAAALWREELLQVEIDVEYARSERRRLPLLADARLGLLRREISRLIEAGGDL